MSKDIKLPEISYEFFIQNQSLWDTISRLRLTPFLESVIIKEIKTMLRDYAVEAVKLNTPEQSDTKQPEPELIPFDLEAAKRGEPIITRDGRKARFIAYVPESDDGYKVVAFIEGGGNVRAFFACGKYLKSAESDRDLFMAPKPKVTVWVNTVEHSSDLSSIGHIYRSEDAAISAAGYYPTTNKAIPIEIDSLFMESKSKPKMTFNCRLKGNINSPNIKVKLV